MAAMTPDEFRAIEEALLAAFDVDSLKRMVHLGLGEKLGHIVALDKNFTIVVYNLVEWAENNGRIDDLVDAAYSHQPNHPKIQALQHARSRTVAPPLPTLILAPVTAPASDTLFLVGSASDTVVWSGEPAPAEAYRLWLPQPPVRTVVLDLEWDEDEPLCRSLQRLLCHHRPGDIKIEVRGNLAWMGALRTCLEEHLPTEGDRQVCSGWSDVVAGGRHAPPSAGGQVYSTSELAEKLEAGLDRWCLGQLNEDVRAAVTTGSGYSGPFLGIEAELAKDMKRIWKVWHGKFDQNPPLCQRFFEMLLSVYDGPSHLWARFGVGPAAIANCMVPGTLFALAVTACRLDDPLSPHGEPPGNLTAAVIRGHACGADRVRGQELDDGIADSKELPWQSQIVLLAKYRQQAEMITKLGRSLAAISDTNIDGAPSLREGALSTPVLVTFEPGFRKAMKQGRKELSDHLTGVLRGLAQRQRSQLDRGPEATAGQPGGTDHE